MKKILTFKKMNKRLLTLSLGLMGLFLGEKCFAQSYELNINTMDCKDIILEMEDDGSSGKVLKPRHLPDGELGPISAKVIQSKPRPKVTMFLDCHQGNSTYPEQTTMNYFTYRQGKLCHGHRVCGNVMAWRGEFKVGTRVYTEATLGQVIQDINASTTTGAEVSVEFKVGFDYIKRFCSPLRDWECLDV